jgi:ubiquinone/menaquinone biosynthesis C-methylase UbiE
VTDRFVGVGNPFRVRIPCRGERVLDVGCGCGLDVFVAAARVGPEGLAVGVDLTFEMLAVPRAAGTRPGACRVLFVQASAETLPFVDESFDQVISNGVLNLVPDKDAAFREISRVLRPGGTLAAADLVVVETLPQEVLADVDAWST